MTKDPQKDISSPESVLNCPVSVEYRGGTARAVPVQYKELSRFIYIILYGTALPAPSPSSLK